MKEFDKVWVQFLNYEQGLVYIRLDSIIGLHDNPLNEDGLAFTTIQVGNRQWPYAVRGTAQDAMNRISEASK